MDCCTSKISAIHLIFNKCGYIWYTISINYKRQYHFHSLLSSLTLHKSMQNLRCHKIIIRTSFIIPNLYHYLQIFNTQVTVLQFMFFSHMIFKVLKRSKRRSPHANCTHMFQQFAIGCLYIGGVETYLKFFIHQV